MSTLLLKRPECSEQNTGGGFTYRDVCHVCNLRYKAKDDYLLIISVAVLDELHSGDYPNKDESHVDFVRLNIKPLSARAMLTNSIGL